MLHIKPCRTTCWLAGTLLDNVNSPEDQDHGPCYELSLPAVVSGVNASLQPQAANSCIQFSRAESRHLHKASAPSYAVSIQYLASTLQYDTIFVDNDTAQDSLVTEQLMHKHGCEVPQVQTARAGAPYAS